MTKLVSGLVRVVIAAAVTLAAALPATAQQATNLGSFNQWTAWKSSDANGVICYISGQPQDMQPAGVNRDPVHFLIIHRSGLGTKNEVQTIIGYPFNTKTPNVSASVDGKAYSMVIEGTAAWLASSGDETTFVAALKKGSKLVVKGTSQRGTNTIDTYSLSGVTAAMTAIDQACA
ncbi:MAG: hypothetical protein JWR75_1613 [Devosia sp.]|nr:hypothetical protein [Devosia sp.]